jgi:hypothetical protein
MEVSVELPPVSAVDYRVDVNIHIFADQRVYGANLFALGQSKKMQVFVTERDLLSTNQQMRLAMEEVASKAARSEIVDREQLLEALRPLAELGYLAFKRVFGKDGETVQELLALLLSESQGRAICMEVSSDDFFFPWELMYPVSPARGPIDINNFWGTRYVIARILTRGLPGQFIQPRIDATAKPLVALLAQKDLGSVVSKEIPYFELLEKSGKIRLSRLDDLNPAERDEGMQKFRDFCFRSSDLFHFAGHASYEDPPDLSYFVVTEKFSISLRDLELYEITDLDRPFVFLNACETGNLNPLYTACFARALFERGARGVLATGCLIPDTFAAEFSKHLYAGLLKGESIGQCLLDVRQLLLNEMLDPCGLFYSLYGPPTIHLSNDVNVLGNRRGIARRERLTRFDRMARLDATDAGPTFEQFGKRRETD